MDAEEEKKMDNYDTHISREQMELEQKKKGPIEGKPITRDLLRKRAEHNEGMLSNLEEVSKFLIFNKTNSRVDLPPLAGYHENGKSRCLLQALEDFVSSKQHYREIRRCFQIERARVHQPRCQQRWPHRKYKRL